MPEDPTSLSSQQLQRNYRLGVASGALQRLLETLADPTLVIAWFISQLTGSPVIIGLLMPVQKGAMHFPQLLVSGAVQRLPRKMPLWRILAAVRLLCWVALAALVLTLGLRNVPLLVGGFLLVYTIYWLTSGIASVAGMDIIGKGISADRRGSFFARREFGGALLALGASVVLRYLLDEGRNLKFPAGYGWIFAIAAVSLAGSVTLFSRMTEPREEAGVSARSDPLPLKRIVEILRKDRNFALFLVGRAAGHLAGGAAPFFLLFFQQKLHAPASMVGVYLGLMTATSIASALLWGRLSDRYGSRAVLVLGALVSLPVPLMPFVLGTHVPYMAYAPALILIGLNVMAYEIAPPKFLLDAAPASNRVIYVGLTNTVLGVMSLLYAVDGLIVQRWGLSAAFVLFLACELVSLSFFLMVREPRASVQPRGKTGSLTPEVLRANAVQPW